MQMAVMLMVKKEIGAVIIIIILLIGIIAFYFLERQDKNKEEQNGTGCVVDADCAPANCCHATTCVSESEKPNCKGIYCTASCEPGTLDCGQGNCACIKGKCNTILE